MAASLNSVILGDYWIFSSSSSFLRAASSSSSPSATVTGFTAGPSLTCKISEALTRKDKPSVLMTMASSLKMSIRSMVPSPFWVMTYLPASGKFFLHSAYKRDSYLRQHSRRPQLPEIYDGFKERYCSRACWVEIGANSRI